MTLTDKPPTEQTATSPTPRRSHAMSHVVTGGVLVLIGSLWLLERTGTVDLNITVVLGLATATTGVALIFLARDGSHAGLMVLGTVLALTALLTAAVPLEGFQGGVGDRTFTIGSVDEIRPDYNLALGKLTIDLRSVEDLTVATPLAASVGTGEILIRVPAGTEVLVDAEVGAGELVVLGRVTNGVSIDETYATPGFAEAEHSLSLQLRAFAGSVEVTDG